MKKTSLMILFFISINIAAGEKLDSYVQLAFKNLDIKNLVELPKKIQKSQLGLENLSNPIEIRGGVGVTTVGSFDGDYDEFEVSYEIELSGEKRRFKSEVLPILNKISEFDSIEEINEIKSTILEILVLFEITNERFNHAKDRKERLQKLGQFLKNNKEKSPQSLANKNLIRLKIEDMEYELYGLNLELKSMRSLIVGIFNDKKLLDELVESPSYKKTRILYQKIKDLPSNLNKYFEIKYSALKSQGEISERTWLPNLLVYGGQNDQDQFGAQAQHTRYIGLGIKIPTEFSFSKKRTLRSSLLKISKIKQKHAQIKAEKEFSNLISSINRKMHFIKLNNRLKFASQERDLNLHFKNLSKGLISLQSYLDLDESIHERFHNTLTFKKELLNDFCELLNLKKQSFDLLGELL